MDMDILSKAFFYTQLFLNYLFITILWIFDLPFLIFTPKLIIMAHKYGMENQEMISEAVNKYISKLYGWRIPDFHECSKSSNPDDYEKPKYPY